jgi:hypothetical protein
MYVDSNSTCSPKLGAEMGLESVSICIIEPKLAELIVALKRRAWTEMAAKAKVIAIYHSVAIALQVSELSSFCKGMGDVAALLVFQWRYGLGS